MTSPTEPNNITQASAADLYQLTPKERLLIHSWADAMATQLVEQASEKALFIRRSFVLGWTEVANHTNPPDFSVEVPEEVADDYEEQMYQIHVAELVRAITFLAMKSRT